MNENELINISDQERKKVRTNSFDLSFNEIIDMYKNQELIITPEYQRLFRWSEEQQSRFIESLILELPVPPIFVIENEDGVYELIDGLQRISSYLNLRGYLEEGKTLKLKGCDIIDSLNDLKYEELPKIIQIRLKRNFIRVEVIRKESDSNLRYHMFKRLNRGGEILSEQEVRNCTIRILDNKFIEFIKKLSENVDFKQTISKLDENQIKFMKDHELILRFFFLKNNIENYNFALDDFLTKYMEGVTIGEIEFDYIKEKHIFEKTFKILNELQGPDIFSTLIEENRVRENFVIYLYDALTLGVSEVIDEISEDNIEPFKEKLNDLKSKETKVGQDIYSKRTGSKSSTKIRQSIVKTHLLGALNE